MFGFENQWGLRLGEPEETDTSLTKALHTNLLTPSPSAETAA